MEIPVRTFEEEQLDNADGSFFGKRFTRNVMMDRMAEYETDCYANLGLCYLLHKMRGDKPSSCSLQAMQKGQGGNILSLPERNDNLSNAQ